MKIKNSSVRVRRITGILICLIALCGIVLQTGQAHADSTLAGYWKFDEASGSSAADSGANGNTGTLNGDAQFSNAQLAPTNYDNSNALLLDGNGDYVSVPDSPSLTFNGEMTAIAWVYWNGSNTAHDDNDVFDKSNGDTPNYRLIVKNNGQLVLWNGSVAPGSTSNIQAGEWTLINFTIGGGQVKFYINGVLAGTSSATVGPTNNSPLYIGRDPAGRYFNGYIDDARLYNKALTEEEVAAIAAGDAGPGLFDTTGLFAGGTGTELDPYQIENCTQLSNIDNDPSLMSAHYILNQDIPCEDTINWDGGQGWTPLASSGVRFTGTLDGDGNSITDLYINRSPTGPLGLFATSEDATFQNLTITGSITNSNAGIGTCMGGLSGYATGYIHIDTVSSMVDNYGVDNTAGGFVGCQSSTSGDSYIVDSSVDATLDNGGVGGLIGSSNLSDTASMDVISSTTAGDFTSRDRAGGLFEIISYLWDNSTSGDAVTFDTVSSSANITSPAQLGGLADGIWLDHRGGVITDSSFTGTITATNGGEIGGLVGEFPEMSNASTLSIDHSYVSSNLAAEGDTVGGLVGSVGNGETLAIDQSYFGGVITLGGSHAGGLVSTSNEATSIDDSYADVTMTGTNYLGGLVGSGTADITNSFADGSIASSGYVLGGIAGSLTNSTVTNVFAAVSIDSTFPTTVSGMVGGVDNVSIVNARVDTSISSQGCISTESENPSSIDCTNEPNNTGDYFFNSSDNSPLDQWDFDSVWQTNDFFYPCLQWQEYCQSFEPQVVCEYPTTTDSTIHGHCDIQTRIGYDYGTTTWIARYKKVGDSDYTSVALDDPEVALSTISGLSPETDYFLEFQFANNWGTGQWARLEITTSASGDSDGVVDAVENAAPNGGDVNQDGIPDSEQANVVSFINPLTNKYVTIVASSGCNIVSSGIDSEDSKPTKDAGFDYPSGLLHFRISYTGTATIEQYFFGIDPTKLVLRKYNARLQSYASVDGAAITKTTVNGTSATKVTYSVSDGGSLDEDGLVNGVIDDPTGLAVNVNGVPNTGFSR